MKTTISKLKYVFFLIVIAGFVSCKGEIGPPGADGIDGIDGTDGNANVQTYVYNNPEWGIFNRLDIHMPDILTDDVIQNDVILGYIKVSGIPYTSPIPGKFDDFATYEVMLFGGTDNLYRVLSYESNGSPTPNLDLYILDWVKIIIIDSANTTTYDGNGGKSLNPQQAIYDELEEAGVNINNYYEVMDYYGLDY